VEVWDRRERQGPGPTLRKAVYEAYGEGSGRLMARPADGEEGR